MIKYKRTELGITKQIEVKSSNNNIDRSYNLMLTMAKMDDTESLDELEPLEQIKLSQQAMHTVRDFLIDVLKLNEKQQAKLGDLEFGETVEIAQDLCMRVLGMDPNEVDEKEEKK